MEQLAEIKSFKYLADFIQVHARKHIVNLLDGKEYSDGKAAKWTEKISEETIKTLSIRNKHFKFLATCFIIQKSEGGLSIGSSCFWDHNNDGNCVVRWENDFMVCILSLFGTRI